MTISVLLSTYNGGNYLKEQLDSLFSQTNCDLKIIARDDGSSDNTVELLQSYSIEIMPSCENVGVKENFSLLLEYGLKHTDSEYFMFCDQDDVWENDKVEKTYKRILELEDKSTDTPLLVHTDLKIVDERLNTISPSFFHHEFIMPRYNSLNRLLMQNTITGCTVMINRKLAKLCLPIPDGAIMHDWWIGLVASKFGKIDYIDESLIQYRQHEKNSIGAKGFSYISILMKFYKLFYKNELYLKDMLANLLQAKAFLDMYGKTLDEEAIKMLEEFTVLESKSFLEKRKILLKYKLLKQSFIRNIGLLAKI